MIMLIRKSKDFFKIEFCDVLKLTNSKTVNKIDSNITIEFSTLFKNCYYSDKIESRYYIKIKCVPDTELRFLNFELFKTKKYDKIIKEKFNISDYYEIEYCLPEKLSEIVSPFKNLKEIIEKFKDLFFENSSVFHINLNKSFLGNNDESEIKFTVKSCPDYTIIEKIKEFVKNFINLANNKLCIEINSEEFYDIMMKGNLNNNNNNNFSLDFNKIDKIFEILKILQDLRRIKIYDSKNLEIVLNNSMYVETDLNEFLQNFDENIEAIKFLKSDLIELILNYTIENGTKKQEIFKLINKVVRKFKNEINEVNNFIKLLKL